MCRESAKIARGDDAALRIGYLRSYSGREVQLALEEFTEKYPGISVQLMYGNHEELFRLLRTEGTDLVLNDQRRAFSNEYVNLILTTSSMYAEISARNPMAALPSATPQELKNIPVFSSPPGNRERSNRIITGQSSVSRGNFCMRKIWRKPVCG